MVRPKVLPSSEIKEDVNPENPRLKRQLSVVLRDQLLNELTGIGSAEEAALYARRILPAKNSLDAADARQLEDAFQTKLAELDGGLGETCAMPSQSVSLPQATSLLEPQGARSLEHLLPKRWMKANLHLCHVAFATRTTCDLWPNKRV